MPKQTARDHAEIVYKALCDLLDQSAADPIVFTRRDVKVAENAVIATRSGVLGGLEFQGKVQSVGKFPNEAEKFAATRESLELLRKQFFKINAPAVV